MVIACTVTVSAPSLTSKNNFNFHQWQWREHGSHLRGGGVASRFSSKSADTKVDAELGRIEEACRRGWQRTSALATGRARFVVA
uniref:Uncharacterized protein n=1 Tax=Oryza punctata TaxID=4537 RepID=A0A0E0K6H1_ORYPU